MKKTTITIRKKTCEELTKLKSHPRATYDEVIQELIRRGKK